MDTRKQNKIEKQYIKYQKIFSHWLKRDLWTPLEYSYLLHGEKPDYFDGIPSDGIENTKAIIERCLGQSLPKASSTPILRTPLIPRTACLTWWKDRIEAHPFWIRAIDEYNQHSTSTTSPKTAKATEARKSTKDIRLHWLAWFLSEIDERASNYNWDRTCIPATKKAIRDVLLQVCPDVKDFSPATLDKELPLFNAKCQRGIKHNDNNVLKTLFKTEIQANKQR